MLSFFFYEPALVETGKYSDRADVRFAVAAGLAASYLLAILGGVWLLSLASSVRRAVLRALLASLALVATAVLLYSAPLLALSALAAACKVQAICPDYANPMGWALSEITWSKEKPFAAAWLAPVVAAVVALKNKANRPRHGEA